MIIVAGGDSFVWGLELADCAHSGPKGYSQKTFPALLAQGMDYHCVAYPGYANGAISRLVISACETLKDIVVLVNWTFPQRYDFRFNYDILKETAPWYSIHSHYPTDKPMDNINNPDLVKALPNFDIIIDDGPHTKESHLEFLDLYVPKLNQGGVLIIEDVENISYGKEYSDKLTNDFQYATLDINTKKEYNSILFVARKI